LRNRGAFLQVTAEFLIAGVEQSFVDQVVGQLQVGQIVRAIDTALEPSTGKQRICIELDDTSSGAALKPRTCTLTHSLTHCFSLVRTDTGWVSIESKAGDRYVLMDFHTQPATGTLHLSANSRSFVGVLLCPSESLRLRKTYEADMTDTPR
jgi:hypothetical protein